MMNRVPALLLALLLPAAARCDAPLPPPAVHEVRSPDASITAVSSPTDGTTVLESGSRRPLWTMPGWYRWLFVANDGECVATGFGGLNLLPLDYRDDMVLVTFWRLGRKVREVRLEEVVPDRTVLARTASHYHWGRIDGFDANGELRVTRRDGHLLRFGACGLTAAGSADTNKGEGR